MAKPGYEPTGLGAFLGIVNYLTAKGVDLETASIKAEEVLWELRGSSFGVTREEAVELLKRLEDEP